MDKYRQENVFCGGLRTGSVLIFSVTLRTFVVTTLSETLEELKTHMCLTCTHTDIILMARIMFCRLSLNVPLDILYEWLSDERITYRNKTCKLICVRFVWLFGKLVLN